MTLLERGGTDSIQLRNRLQSIPRDDLATTIISYEKQLRGWLAVISQARFQESELATYQRLKRMLRIYSNITDIGYDDFAAAEFAKLKAKKIRIGTKDLKNRIHCARKQYHAFNSKHPTILSKSPTLSSRIGRSNFIPPQPTPTPRTSETSGNARCEAF